MPRAAVFFEQRGLGGLFIPGVPILVTGGLLFVANLFNHCGLWARWWTLEVLAVGAGFSMAAIWLRVTGRLSDKGLAIRYGRTCVFARDL